MRVFWSVLAVIALSATEALAANWNKATVYPPESLVDQLKRQAALTGDQEVQLLRCCKHRLRRSLERRH